MVFKRTLPVFLALLMLAVMGLGVYTVLNHTASGYPRTAAEKDLVNETLYHIETNLQVLDFLTDAGYKALDKIKQYITGGSVNDADLTSQLNISETQITDLIADFTMPSDQLLEQLRHSPLETTEFIAMYDTLIAIANSRLLIIEDLRWMTGPDCMYSSSQKQKILDCDQISWDEDMRACGYAVNESLLPTGQKIKRLCKALRRNASISNWQLRMIRMPFSAITPWSTALSQCLSLPQAAQKWQGSFYRRPSRTGQVSLLITDIAQPFIPGRQLPPHSHGVHCRHNGF